MIAHPSKSKAAAKSARAEFPWSEYPVAWQVFRETADEDQQTASHLIGRPSWPDRKGLVLIDIGSGDGRIVEAIVGNKLQKQHNISEVRFLDPNLMLLTKAKEAVRGKIPVVKPIQAHLRDEGVWPLSGRGSDVALAVHVVYLMEDGELTHLIENLPPETTLFVVLDAPTSVFTELWAETAKLYHDRAMAAHQTMERIRDRKVIVSEITASIPRAELRKHPTADWLLSLLCYRDMRSQNVSPRMLSRVHRILDQHTGPTGDVVHCRSRCYEFPALDGSHAAAAIGI